MENDKKCQRTENLNTQNQQQEENHLLCSQKEVHVNECYQ